MMPPPTSLVRLWLKTGAQEVEGSVTEKKMSSAMQLGWKSSNTAKMRSPSN